MTDQEKRDAVAKALAQITEADSSPETLKVLAFVKAVVSLGCEVGENQTPFDFGNRPGMVQIRLNPEKDYLVVVATIPLCSGPANWMTVGTEVK